MGLQLWNPEFQRPEFVGTDFKSEFRMDMPEDDYHRDLTAVSRGDVVAFLHSPMHMVARRMKTEMEETDALRFGRAAHALLLEPDRFKREFILRPDFGDLRTKAGKEARDTFNASVPKNALSLNLDEMRDLFGMAQAIARNQTAMGLLEGGLVELTTYYRDPITGLKCRVKPDLVNRQVSALVDFKTYRPGKNGVRDFYRTVLDFKYELQLAMYREGVYAVTGEYPETLAIIGVQKDPPYTCTVFDLDISMRERGMRDYRKGLDGIARCLESNYWHEAEEVLTVSEPAWARRE